MSLEITRAKIPVLYSQMLIREAKSCGQDISEIIKGTKLSLLDLENPEHKITPQTQNIILHNVLQKIECSSTHLAFTLGASLHTSSHGTIGILLLSSPNIKTMFEQFVKYASYSLPFGRISHRESSSHIILELDEVLPELHHDFYFETAAASIHKTLEDVLGSSITGASLHFPYSPKHPNAYPEHFHHAVYFSSSKFEYHIPKNILLLPSLLYNPDLYKYTQLLCEHRLIDHDQSNVLTQKVRNLLYSSPTKTWIFSDVATHCNMSERSVYRKLKREGASYKSIYDDVRKALTQQYLTETDLSINQIAALLGFNDASNFRRLFKRWFGISPSQFISMSDNKSDQQKQSD
ncbi:MAG: AraC-like DNA-binding protein [Patiriisocius sp.]|jgi:AraC-like DNA-binding protein